MKIMTNGPQKRKLKELRAKTDRQLLALINSSLTRGMERVRQYSDFAGAECAYREARLLLPLVDNVNESETARLEARLAQLGEFLNRAMVCAGMRGAA
jgi:hypothetical protein